MSKVIITAALNGLTTHRGECPKVPFTPEEIAAEAQRAVDAGASIVHVHAREEGGAPSYRSERYYEVIQAIRDRCSVLISVSTGAFGVSLEDRLASVNARPDYATLPMGTMSYARYNKATQSFDYDHTFANPFGDMIAVAECMREKSVHVVATCYDMGHISSAVPLRDMGLWSDGEVFDLHLGVTGGISANTHNLARMASELPERSQFFVTAVGSAAWAQRAAAVSLGGHIRVGFEDGVALPDGDEADSNGALVSSGYELIRAMGYEVAEPDDVRELLHSSSTRPVV